MRATRSCPGNQANANHLVAPSSGMQHGFRRQFVRIARTDHHLTAAMPPMSITLTAVSPVAGKISMRGNYVTVFQPQHKYPAHPAFC
jgi:hypothetical protein